MGQKCPSTDTMSFERFNQDLYNGLMHLKTDLNIVGLYPILDLFFQKIPIALRLNVNHKSYGEVELALKVYRESGPPSPLFYEKECLADIAHFLSISKP